METSRQRGFTLIELMVIIAIIGLLVSILIPSFGAAVGAARKSVCANNVREIVRACTVYADEARNNRGRTAGAYPSDVTGPWYNSATGNRNCMWLLVEYKYASPGLFTCPALTDYKEARFQDGAFRNNTCGYSYISMVGRTAGAGAALPILTSTNCPSNLVIVADLNPRCKAGSNGFDAQMNQKNSASHGLLRGQNAGQNVGSVDGSSTWRQTSKVVTGSNSDDWIYQSADEAAGKCGPEDVLLIP